MLATRSLHHARTRTRDCPVSGAGQPCLGSPAWAAPTADDIQKAEKAVAKKIEELQGDGLLPTQRITHEALEKALPHNRSRKEWL